MNRLKLFNRLYFPESVTPACGRRVTHSYLLKKIGDDKIVVEAENKLYIEVPPMRIYGEHKNEQYFLLKYFWGVLLDIKLLRMYEKVTFFTCLRKAIEHIRLYYWDKKFYTGAE